MANEVRGEAETRLIDRYGRIINYLRLSVTDRCNLKCLYCQPPHEIEYFDRSEICSYGELLFIAQIASSVGIQKIRLTGGELFLRKEVIEFMNSLRKIENIKEIALTTNGTLLLPHLKRLKEIGIRRINVSLDTLSEGLYSHITGSHKYFEVLDGIHKALEQGFEIKINMVVLNGINEAEIIKFINYFLKDSVEVRFIEFMPLCGKSWKEEYFFPYRKIKDLITKDFALTPLPSSGVAREFRLIGGNGLEGKIGIIAPVSRSFCPSCSRIRLSSNGELRPCLFSGAKFELLPLLRSDFSLDEKRERIKKSFRLAVKMKPLCAFKGPDAAGVYMRNLGG